jgi:hypothetical protein
VARMEGGQVHTGFWWGNLRERDHLKDLGIDGRIILKCPLMKQSGGHGLNLCCDSRRDKWRAFVNKFMNFGFSKMQGTVSFSRRTLLHRVGWLIIWLDS